MNSYALRTRALGPSCHVLTDLKLNGVKFSVFDTPIPGTYTLQVAGYDELCVCV